MVAIIAVIGLSYLISHFCFRRLRGFVWGALIFVISAVLGWALGVWLAGGPGAISAHWVGKTFWFAVVGSGVGLWNGRRDRGT